MSVSTVMNSLLDRLGDFSDRQWQMFSKGVEVSWFYSNGKNGPASALLRYEPGASVPLHWHRGYEHIFVLEGSQSDDNGLYQAGSLLISPPGSSHTITSLEGCIVLAVWQVPVSFSPLKK